MNVDNRRTVTMFYVYHRISDKPQQQIVFLYTIVTNKQKVKYIPQTNPSQCMQNVLPIYYMLRFNLSSFDDKNLLKR